jgi:hypothetical protein
MAPQEPGSRRLRGGRRLLGWALGSAVLAATPALAIDLEKLVMPGR